jgi:hypothetical protein
MEWSQRSREWITEAVQREVKRQLGAAGIATREDLDAIRKRVRELEKASKGGASKRAAGAAKGAAKRSTATRAKPPATQTSSVDRSPAGTADASGLGDPGPPSA